MRSAQGSSPSHKSGPASGTKIKNQKAKLQKTGFVEEAVSLCAQGLPPAM